MNTIRSTLKQQNKSSISPPANKRVSKAPSFLRETILQHGQVIYMEHQAHSLTRILLGGAYDHTLTSVEMDRVEREPRMRLKCLWEVVKQQTTDNIVRSGQNFHLKHLYSGTLLSLTSEQACIWRILGDGPIELNKGIQIQNVSTELFLFVSQNYNINQNLSARLYNYGTSITMRLYQTTSSKENNYLHQDDVLMIRLLKGNKELISIPIGNLYEKKSNNDGQQLSVGRNINPCYFDKKNIKTQWKQLATDEQPVEDDEGNNLWRICLDSSLKHHPVQFCQEVRLMCLRSGLFLSKIPTADRQFELDDKPTPLNLFKIKEINRTFNDQKKNYDEYVQYAIPVQLDCINGAIQLYFLKSSLPSPHDEQFGQRLLGLLISIDSFGFETRVKYQPQEIIVQLREQAESIQEQSAKMSKIIGNIEKELNQVDSRRCRYTFLRCIDILSIIGHRIKSSNYLQLKNVPLQPYFQLFGRLEESLWRLVQSCLQIIIKIIQKLNQIPMGNIQNFYAAILQFQQTHTQHIIVLLQIAINFDQNDHYFDHFTSLNVSINSGVKNSSSLVRIARCLLECTYDRTITINYLRQPINCCVLINQNQLVLQFDNSPPLILKKLEEQHTKDTSQSLKLISLNLSRHNIQNIKQLLTVHLDFFIESLLGDTRPEIKLGLLQITEKLMDFGLATGPCDFNSRTFFNTQLKTSTMVRLLVIGTDENVQKEEGPRQIVGILTQIQTCQADLLTCLELYYVMSKILQKYVSSGWYAISDINTVEETLLTLLDKISQKIEQVKEHEPLHCYLVRLTESTYKSCLMDILHLKSRIIDCAPDYITEIVNTVTFHKKYFSLLSTCQKYLPQLFEPIYELIQLAYRSQSQNFSRIDQADIKQLSQIEAPQLLTTIGNIINNIQTLPSVSYVERREMEDDLQLILAANFEEMSRILINMREKMKMEGQKGRKLQNLLSIYDVHEKLLDIVELGYVHLDSSLFDQIFLFFQAFVQDNEKNSRSLIPFQLFRFLPERDITNLLCQIYRHCSQTEAQELILDTLPLSTTYRILLNLHQQFMYHETNAQKRQQMKMYMMQIMLESSPELMQIREWKQQQSEKWSIFQAMLFLLSQLAKDNEIVLEFVQELLPIKFLTDCILNEQLSLTIRKPYLCLLDTILSKRSYDEIAQCLTMLADHMPIQMYMNFGCYLEGKEEKKELPSVFQHRPSQNIKYEPPSNITAQEFWNYQYCTVVNSVNYGYLDFLIIMVRHTRDQHKLFVENMTKLCKFFNDLLSSLDNFKIHYQHRQLMCKIMEFMIEMDAIIGKKYLPTLDSVPTILQIYHQCLEMYPKLHINLNTFPWKMKSANRGITIIESEHIIQDNMTNNDLMSSSNSTEQYLMYRFKSAKTMKNLERQNWKQLYNFQEFSKNSTRHQFQRVREVMMMLSYHFRQPENKQNFLMNVTSTYVEEPSEATTPYRPIVPQQQYQLNNECMLQLIHLSNMEKMGDLQLLERLLQTMEGSISQEVRTQLWNKLIKVESCNSSKNYYSRIKILTKIKNHSGRDCSLFVKSMDKHMGEQLRREVLMALAELCSLNRKSTDIVMNKAFSLCQSGQESWKLVLNIFKVEVLHSNQENRTLIFEQESFSTIVCRILKNIVEELEILPQQQLEVLYEAFELIIESAYNVSVEAFAKPKQQYQMRLMEIWKKGKEILQSQTDAQIIDIMLKVKDVLCVICPETTLSHQLPIDSVILNLNGRQVRFHYLKEITLPQQLSLRIDEVYDAVFVLRDVTDNGKNKEEIMEVYKTIMEIIQILLLLSITVYVFIIGQQYQVTITILLTINLAVLLLKVGLQIYMYEMKSRILKKIKKNMTWNYPWFRLMLNLFALTFAAIAISNYYIASVCLLFKAFVLMDGDRIKKQFNKEDWAYLAFFVYWLSWNLVFYVLMGDLRKNTPLQELELYLFDHRFMSVRQRKINWNLLREFLDTCILGWYIPYIFLGLLIYRLMRIDKGSECLLCGSAGKVQKQIQIKSSEIMKYIQFFITLLKKKGVLSSQEKKIITILKERDQSMIF